MSKRPFADNASRRPLALAPQALGVVYEESEPAEVETAGQIAVVCIEGPLAQKPGWFDDYASIQERFLYAMSQPGIDAIVLNIDSPGGDVAGLFECAKTMRAAKTKPVYAYVDESCYSAAYALAMVADEVYLPPSGGCGSIGVITCMVDVTGNNEEHGIRVEVITSGDQKADGHPDVPITDEAIARTQERVDELAQMFFSLVSESRGLPAETIAGYEAGIFQGQSAVDAGLADGVMSWSEMLRALTSSVTATSTSTTTRNPMGSKLAEIREQNAAAAAAAAAAPSQAEVKFKHTKKSVEVIESEDEPTSSSEEDDKDEDEEDDKKDSKKAALILREFQALTGHTSKDKMLGTLRAMKDASSRETSMAQRLASVEAELSSVKMSALVKSGLKAGKLAPAQKAWALTQSPDALQAYLDATPAMVRPAEEALAAPKAIEAPKALTADQKKILDSLGITDTAAAMAFFGKGDGALREVK